MVTSLTESIIFSSQRNEIPTPPKPSDGDGGEGKAAGSEGGVHGGDGEPVHYPTTDEQENQGMNPIIGANCAGSAELQENISNGPLYGDWITVSRNRKSNKQKHSHAGQKGEKGACSTNNKFQILGPKGVQINETNKSRDKGKGVLEASSTVADKPIKTWVRKRQRKESASLKASPIEKELVAAHLTNHSLALTKPTNNGSTLPLRPASETCHSWSDGTKTSLPVACVSANHFRFRDEGEKDATSSIVFNSEQEINVVLPTPKEPPDDRCKEPHVNVSESHRNVHVPQSSREVDGSC
ncbi:hypothetical protein SESBI_41199 [Sesbania bispinosa]|nr:hypothetical protein SESBI_41199 [Sesbania bispinosa]